MPHLRILVGYTEPHRKGTATVLAATRDTTAIQQAINEAPAEFLRFDVGVFSFQRSGRRAFSAPSAPAAPAAEAPAPAAEAPAPTDPAPTDTEGDSLSIESEVRTEPPRKSRKPQVGDDGGPALIV